jgi:hypothetical protein
MLAVLALLVFCRLLIHTRSHEVRSAGVDGHYAFFPSVRIALAILEHDIRYFGSHEQIASCLIFAAAIISSRVTEASDCC